MASVPLLQPRSTHALGPAGLLKASSPMMARVLGAFKGRTFSFFSRTIPSRATARATTLWSPWTFGPPVPFFQELNVRAGYPLS